MEKSICSRRKIYSLGLLKKIIFTMIFMSAVFVYSADYSNLRVKPQSQFGFTGENCTFELIVPNLSPSLVKTTMQDLPKGVTFVYSRKSEVFIDNEKATKIELVFSFEKPGVYKLPRLAARIGYGGYALYFDKIEIIENPMTLVPEVFFKIVGNEELKVGKTVEILLCAKYFKRINNISPILNENMLFAEKKRFIDLPYSFQDFTTEIVEVALYEWTPLVEGVCELPSVAATFEAWNSLHQILTTEKATRKVAASRFYKVDENKLNEPYFFAEESDKAIMEQQNEIDVATAKLNAFLSHQALKKKLVRGIVILLVCFALCIIVFVILKKKKLIVCFVVLIVVFGISLLFFAISFSKEYVICTGDYLYKIPNSDSTTSVYIPNNSLFKVEIVTDEWVQVLSANDTKGWLKKDKVVFLEK